MMAVAAVVVGGGVVMVTAYGSVLPGRCKTMIVVMIDVMVSSTVMRVNCCGEAVVINECGVHTISVGNSQELRGC